MLEEMWEGERDDCVRPSAAGIESAPPGAHLLRAFVDTFVQEEFLPEVYVDFRCGSGTPFVALISRSVQVTKS